ncbi:MAG: glycosyltransferase, partial [Acidobacteria bacterium]|nr:glycosyltransferase [Acidobacteriota bacterium]
MKIGFFGNTNNYPFMIARAVRKMGHEVLFVVNSDIRLYRPEHRYSDISYPYPDWIRDLGHFRPWDFVLPTPRRHAAVKTLRKCDAVILNEFGPSLLPLIQKPAVVLLTGSDLEVYSNFRAIDSVADEAYQKRRYLPRGVVRYGLNELSKMQRAGIRSAEMVNYFVPGLSPMGDALLDEIGVPVSRRTFFQLTDLDNLILERQQCNNPPRIFCATRLTWKKPISAGMTELDYKGSDIMIRGLAKFVRTTGTPLEIRLVKKGMHVTETLQLVREEGLEPYVTWLDEMTQLQILDEFRQADIVFEQLAKSAIGMAGLDAMAMGRPVIGNGRPEVMEPALGVRMPICQAETPEDVCAQLTRLVSNPDERK